MVISFTNGSTVVDRGFALTLMQSVTAITALPTPEGQASDSMTYAELTEPSDEKTRKGKGLGVVGKLVATPASDDVKAR